MTRRALVFIEGNTAGTGQLYVRAAQDLGLHPIVLAAPPVQYDYLKEKCIEAIVVDTKDLDALIRECSRLRSTYDVAGITCAREAFYATSGKLCRHFGLPGPNPEAVERCCNKFTQRQLLKEGGVSVPSYFLAVNTTEVISAAAEIGFPVVVKPVVGVGSAGVRLCCNVDELCEQTSHLLNSTDVRNFSSGILIEELARGPHFSVETMGTDVIGVCAADFGPPPHFVYRHFAFPAPLNEYEYQRIVDVAQSSLRALGLEWGPANIELRWTSRGPVVIEVNPRLAGTPDPQLILLAYGIDLITEHIKLAIGEESTLHRRRSHTAAARILVPDRDGTLTWSDSESRLAVLPGVAEVKLYLATNTPIIRKGDARDWIGHVIAVSPSLAQCEAILQNAVDQIDWTITPFPT
ncbi:MULTISPECIES: ATP-grasp domain-containing protein [Rhizobium]|uniref:Putative carboxylase protein n=1 Tax=Rhizobium etli (strain CIAT 652) TaxID=491916 RepID=B3Q278_RHIE6|nr:MULTISPECIES: ATP-grasp domain-containing protein [Rhizobium]ACE93784.1 putative carboxylase protein [Rhizobium etli CIAT 652]OHV21587.1 hypothetical protein BBJ66_30890 [Rhizobium sp. RSm-3]RVU06022.1 ATP-grasp domain-containing protein [Rhizobium sp. RMa-01]WHO76585.1 ATP-grasp domain-containing protein [Rhizobium sp. BT03]